MRKSVFILIVIASVMSLGIAEAKEKDADIDMSAAPFWMSSFEEFRDLREEQKKFYLEKLVQEFKKLSGLEKVTLHELKEAADWTPSWNTLRRKLYVACQDKEMEKTCEEIADVRIAALEMGSPRAPVSDLDTKKENGPAEK
ncbi:MAG: hypothetical protein OM95_01575 [Bdellovibrio sp. ArHS]|uniref:hypothetical protein n=1 Tax=Bdellovibrio sp. ArHS TaxID=1569284 RepID=UPI000583D87F|nr:hypothetical protein [Bdellovibrio sp. ArHS]KHD89787.1 MAG: hypothetical protein OM95_01575 [Bdellovibrio sp. ArHS]